jgi:hypothetical protein
MEILNRPGVDDLKQDVGLSGFEGDVRDFEGHVTSAVIVPLKSLGTVANAQAFPCSRYSRSHSKRLECRHCKARPLGIANASRFSRRHEPQTGTGTHGVLAFPNISAA